MIPLIYKEIKEGLYLIENDGRIYSKTKHKYLIPHKDKDGYLCIGLQRKNEKNKRIYYRIATLVAYSFIGPPPSNLKDPTINHIDNNILNNYYLNLEWIERGINSSIRKNKGEGINNHEAKLDEAKVYEICKKLASTSLTLTEIGEQYNIKKSTVHSIFKKKSWKNITMQFDFSSRKTIRNDKGQFEVINLKCGEK